MTPGWAGIRRLCGLVALVVVIAALVSCTWFRLAGGHWERVESPSMGTTAPVGSLLWVQPVAASQIRVGDVISFHRPDAGPDGPVYSHRVRTVLADGGLQTGGDLSGPDQWRVPPSALVGRVDRIWPGVGWLVLAIPLLALGGLLTFGLARLVARRDRHAALATVMVGAAVTAVAVLIVYHPLTGVEQIDTVRQGAGADSAVRVDLVSTGLLPVRVSAPGAEPVRLRAGESGGVLVSAGSLATVTPDVPIWLWPALVGPCLAPAVVLTARRRRSSPSSDADLASVECHRRPQQPPSRSEYWPFRATSASTSPS